MTIRCATREDLAAIVLMAAKFAAADSYRGFVSQNVEQLEQLARFLLEHGAIFVAEDTRGPAIVVGMIGVSVLAHPIDGAIVGSEVAWWIEPDFRGGSAGVRLLEAAEAWARAMGATRFQMVAPALNPRVGEFYRRRGYAEVETTWQRELAGEGV
jgi:GNAT superfamily N-acetyltransferase